MKIDITKLLQNSASVININDNVIIPEQLLKGTLIDELKMPLLMVKSL